MRRFLLVCGKYAITGFMAWLTLSQWNWDTWQCWAVTVAGSLLLAISETCQEYLRRDKE